MAPDRVPPVLLVLDTNIVLDLLVFSDPAARPLQTGLAQGTLDWLATPAMRDELERVLGYAQIASRLVHAGMRTGDVLADFDRRSRIVEAAAKAPVTCSDADDQMFIDLAVRHRCLLLSKDAAVLALKKRLATFEVDVAPSIPSAPSYNLIGFDRPNWGVRIPTIHSNKPEGA